MTPTEYNSTCAAVGLEKQGQQADFFGVSIRTAHGWANGSPIPTAVAKLLRLMKAHKLNAEDVK